MHQNRYTSDALDACFYKNGRGSEPVRDWLNGQDKPTRKTIGQDIKTVQLGWPLGMPLVRKMEAGLWEVRSAVPAGIARVFFTVCDSRMVLLHAIVKKSGTTPRSDLEVARSRKREVQNG